MNIELRKKFIEKYVAKKDHKLRWELDWDSYWQGSCTLCGNWCRLYKDGDFDNGTLFGNPPLHFFYGGLMGIRWHPTDDCSNFGKRQAEKRKKFRKEKLHGLTYKELFERASELFLNEVEDNVERNYIDKYDCKPVLA
jgi:hypothetical protein